MTRRAQVLRGVRLSLVLFGLPALLFAGLFHLAGPAARAAGASWLAVFNLILTVPLGLMLVAALTGAARDEGTHSVQVLVSRLRLGWPQPSAWLWAAGLAGFMYGGAAGDSAGIAAAWCALWMERSRSPVLYAAVVVAVAVKRICAMWQPALASVQFFEPSSFYTAFFRHFGPADFMGVPLIGAWWIVAGYVAWMLLFNIGGEELWWRGYVLPRQERAFGAWAWVVHGVCWALFHLFMQPTLADTVRMTVTGLALAFTAQRTRSTWPGVVGHACGNLPFVISLAQGLR